MFASLVDYHGGGAAAALEPLSENIHTWEWTLATFLGAGVGACYRGDRLYDSPEVQAMVSSWTDFWVKYRRILTEDIIHVRRPTVSGIDALLHVSSAKQHPDDAFAALAVVYNPSNSDVDTPLKLPLYYSGLEDRVLVAERDGDPQSMELERDFGLWVHVKLDARSITWFAFSKDDGINAQ